MWLNHHFHDFLHSCESQVMISKQNDPNNTLSTVPYKKNGSHGCTEQVTCTEQMSGGASKKYLTRRLQCDATPPHPTVVVTKISDQCSWGNNLIALQENGSLLV